MCTVTLSYNEKDALAKKQLAALLSTGLFVQLNMQDGIMIDDSDSSLFEDDGMSLPVEKDFYTPEELRTFLIDDLNQVYGVKNAV